MSYIQSAVGYDVLKWNLSISENKGASSGKSGKSEVRELHFQRGPLSFSVAPSHEGRAHQMLMQVNIRCHICLSFSQSVPLFY